MWFTLQFGVYIQPRHGQWILSDYFSKFWFGSNFKRSMTGLTSPKFFQRLISFQPKLLARARLIPDMPLVKKSPFSLSVKFNSNWACNGGKLYDGQTNLFDILASKHCFLTYQFWYKRCLSGAGCWKGNFWGSKKMFFLCRKRETFFTFSFEIAEPAWMKPWVLLAEGLLPTPAPETAASVLDFPKKRSHFSFLWIQRFSKKNISNFWVNRDFPRFNRVWRGMCPNPAILAEFFGVQRYWVNNCKIFVGFDLAFFLFVHQIYFYDFTDYVLKLITIKNMPTSNILSLCQFVYFRFCPHRSGSIPRWYWVKTKIFPSVSNPFQINK